MGPKNSMYNFICVLSIFFSAPEEILAIEDSRDPKNQKKAGTGNWKYTVKNSMFYGGDKEAEKVYGKYESIKKSLQAIEKKKQRKSNFIYVLAGLILVVGLSLVCCNSIHGLEVKILSRRGRFQVKKAETSRK